MAQSYRATTADELRAISEQHQTNGQDSNEVNITLALFLPFSDTSLLLAGRNPPHPQTINASDEYLNLDPLRKYWREAWIELFKTLETPRLTISFDATLPNISTEDGLTQGIWWSTQGNAVGVQLIDREFVALLVTLATQARMVRKAPTTFKMLEESLSGPGMPHLDRMRKDLEALSR